MKYLNNYNQFEDRLYEEFELPELDIDWTKVNNNIKTEEQLKIEYLKELGKNGKLLDYIKQGHKEELTFGILKALFYDAIEYKKKRELTKGFSKFLIRAIPLVLASVWFPIWIIAQILGGSRSLNKILVPVLRMKQSNYKSFLFNLITRTMNLMEGEVKMFMEDDWYYRVFMVDWGLINMIKHEHIFDFANHLAEKMSLESDDKVAPSHYVENELRTYLNNKFNLQPPLPLRTDDNYSQNENYNIYKEKLLAS